MKSLIFVFLFLCINAYSFDTSVKGFIALDALNYEKIQSKNGYAVVGIGVLDLKVFAEQDNMTAALKLDLDGNLAEENNIFEEAYATYRGVKDFRFSLGKGVVKFQNLHWGAVENTYLDGGSLLGTDNNFRKASKKAFASVGYGHRSRGFLNIFTFFGESTEIDADEQGNPYYMTSGTKVTAYKTKTVTAFSTEKQTGFANKLELYQFNNLTLTQGLYYYKNKVQPDPSIAIDFGLSYETPELEIWMDTLAGYSSKGMYEKYSTRRLTEYFIQLGGEKFLDETWSVVLNTEALYTKNQQHTFSNVTIKSTTYTPDSALVEKSGQTTKSLNYKVESAVKYKISKSAFVTVGGLYERKIAEKNGQKNLSYIPGVFNANKEAFKLSSSVSFWF